MRVEHWGRRRLLAGVLTVAFATAGLAACGGGDAGDAEAATPRAGGESLDQLYERATSRGEDRVNLYNPFPPGYERLVEAFEQRFPDIEVAQTALGGTQLAARLRAEVSSGRQEADVVTSGVIDFLPLADEDVFTPYSPDSASELPAEHRGPDDWVLAPQLQIGITPYNTDAVASDDAPSSWQDLADPRWHGVIGSGDLEQATSGTLLYLSVLYAEGIIDDAWLEAVKANAPTVYPSSGALSQAVATGQSDITLVQSNTSPYLAELDGAPIARPVMDEGNPALQQPVGVVRGAPHPNAAKLLAAWFFTEEAQGIFVEAGAFGAMPGSPKPVGLEDARLIVTSLAELGSQLPPAVEAVQEVLGR